MPISYVALSGHGQYAQAGVREGCPKCPWTMFGALGPAAVDAAHSGSMCQCKLRFQRENSRRHEGALSSHSFGLKLLRQGTEKWSSLSSDQHLSTVSSCRDPGKENLVAE